jgi:folate-dependent phosphoribosylglycinamide formyltransferase PurN
MSRKRVGVLISGRGSNMAALIDAAKDDSFPAEIVLVASNVADAGGSGERALGRHRNRGPRTFRIRQGSRGVRARAASGTGQPPH